MKLTFQVEEVAEARLAAQAVIDVHAAGEESALVLFGEPLAHRVYVNQTRAGYVARVQKIEKPA